jgi:serine/threonine-protein kinase
MKRSFHTAGTLVGGRYRLIELAGQGGMAEVWRADLEGAEGFRRPVAVKRILRHLVNSKEHRAMFVQEACLTATVDHPNVVQIYDFGEDPSGLFIVMEWVEGITLSNLAALCTVHGVLPSPALAAAVGIEVLRGLEAAHENVVLEPDGSTRKAQIIHRDISPSNVMLSIRGIVKLADFGLARAMHQAAGALTPAGFVKGKLAYMAPEILRGKPASPQTDIYSTGVMLWEMICGRRLFAGKTDVVGALLRSERAPSIRELRPDAPPTLAAAVDRALSIDAGERYVSASAFARALSDVLRTIPERTDTSRLAREVVNATVAWRRLVAEQQSTEEGTHSIAAGKVGFDFSTLEPAAEPEAPPSESVHFDPEAEMAAQARAEAEYLADAELNIEEPSSLLAIPLVARSGAGKSSGEGDKPRKA